MRIENASRQCQEIHELLPAYSIGATDSSENQLVESHLLGCPEARAELAGYRALAATMLLSTPPLEPPPGLAHRLLEATQAQPARQPAQDSLVQRLWELLSAPRMRPAYAVAALALVLLVGMSLFWSQQLQSLRAEQELMARQLAQQADLLGLVGEGELLRISIPAAPAGADTGANATVVGNPEATVGFLVAENLPQLAPDQIYQVWLIRDDERISGGLFEVDPEGNGRLAFQAPRPLKEFDAVGITPEPAGGSPGPTAPPVIRGSLHDENYQSSRSIPSFPAT